MQLNATKSLNLLKNGLIIVPSGVQKAAQRKQSGFFYWSNKKCFLNKKGFTRFHAPQFIPI